MFHHLSWVRSCYALGLAVGLLMLTSNSVQAQRFPTYSPPPQPPFPTDPFRFNTIPTPKGMALPLPGKGSYQTLDSVWHKARISFLAYGIRVDDVNAVIDPEVAAPIIPLQQVLCIVVRHDTLGFRVVADEQSKRKRNREEYQYFKQLFRGGGWTVYPGFLKDKHGTYIAVPSHKDEFQKLMLEHFGGCAQLRKQIEEGIFDTRAAEAIVRQYAHWVSLSTAQLGG